MVRAARIRPDMLLADEAILEAGHALYALAYENECEERGIQNTPGGCNICDWVPHADPDTIRPIVWYYVGRISNAWGHPVGRVFYHMGLRDAESQGTALYRLLMGCAGHGVSLADDHGDQLDRASEVLLGDPGKRQFDPSPIDAEMDEFRELAYEAVSKIHGPF